MKVIGYNSSHETSLCQFDTDTWDIDFLYEEERFRRTKYWFPKPPQDQLLCIERSAVEKPDAFIGASFDRRLSPLMWDTSSLQYDKKAMQEIIEFIQEEQMTHDRIVEMIQKFKKYIPTEDYKHLIKEYEEKVYLESEQDDGLHGRVADQLQMEEFHYEIEHHLYHAECGYWFSPWREKEKAIAIAMDGGGCHKYSDKGYPNFQEVETIFLCQPKTKPTRQWGRLSNYRWITDMNENKALYNMQRGQIIKAPDKIETFDGAECVFNSYPSQGMNFSALSLFFGYDKLGRAAGKVMGAASYQPWEEHEDGYIDYSTYALGNLLQQKSFEYTCGIIQRAIDLNPDVPNIILSGGFALNCTNNAKYLERFPNHQIFIDPVAHDGGTAVGAAIRLGRALLEGEDV